MRSSAWRSTARVAAIGAIVLLESVPAHAQAPAPVEVGSRALAAMIASEWHVAPERVRIAWIGLRDSAGAEHPVAIRSAGDAAGAEWLVTTASRREERARAGTVTPEPRAAHDIPRGTALTAQDIVADSVVRWGPPIATSELAQPGWITHSVIRTGVLLRSPAVAPPPAIRVGDTVQVIWQGSGVVASARGRAAATVAPGEPVAVRLDNGRRIEGRAVRPGRVRIP
jgi:flagella basal body P-ring formation protein FlgA